LPIFGTEKRAEKSNIAHERKHYEQFYGNAYWSRASKIFLLAKPSFSLKQAMPPAPQRQGKISEPAKLR
jgi:hypothetical protein